MLRLHVPAPPRASLRENLSSAAGTGSHAERGPSSSMPRRSARHLHWEGSPKDPGYATFSYGMHHHLLSFPLHLTKHSPGQAFSFSLSPESTTWGSNSCSTPPPYLRAHCTDFTHITVTCNGCASKAREAANYP